MTLTDQQVNAMMAAQLKAAGEYADRAVLREEIAHTIKNVIAFAYMEGFRDGQSYAREHFVEE